MFSLTAQEELAEKLKTESTQKAELTAALTKKDEKLKKKEKLLNEQTQSQNAMEKELDTTKKEVSSQKTLIKRLETALVSQLFVYVYLSRIFLLIYLHFFRIKKKNSTSMPTKNWPHSRHKFLVFLKILLRMILLTNMEFL